MKDLSQLHAHLTAFVEGKLATINSGQKPVFDFNRSLESASAVASAPKNSPLNPAPYKPRLEKIFHDLCETEERIHAFANYLSPSPGGETAGNAKTRATPYGMDELLSAIESQLNVNHLLIGDLQNKF